MTAAPAALVKGALDIAIVAHDASGVAEFLRVRLGCEEGRAAPVPGGVRVPFAFGGHVIKLVCLDAPPPRASHPPLDAVGFRVVLVPSARVTGDDLLVDPDGTNYRLTGEGGAVGVELTTRDVDLLAAFYRRSFGLDPGAGDDGVVLEWGATRLIFRKAHPHAVVLAEGRQGASGVRYLTALVADVDALHALVCAAGGREVLAPTAHGSGVRFSIVADPDGNWLELGSRPAESRGR